MDQIDEIRRKTDIVELISTHVSLKKAGRNFKGLCPFHEEKSPSFIVSPERQIFKCFGCQEGGDIYGFLMKREGLDFGEALRTLAQKAGVELKQYKPSKDQELKDRLLEINHLASEYYHYLLMEHKLGKKALQYLLKRGITKSSMKTFKLGYASDEWEGLQSFLVGKKKYKVEELEKAGLVIKSPNRQNSYYDRFRGRVMFSLFDHRNRVVGFAGRVMKGDEKQAKYVNSPETMLYHKSSVLYGLEITRDQIKKKNKAVVVEGEIDAISSYQAGVKNVVAIKGSALTEEQIDLLKRFAENIALALDKDAAGDQAARRGIELAEKAGLSVRVIKLKYGKDPDECAQKSSRFWKDSVKEAVPVYDFVIDSAVERYGVDSPEGKKKVSEEASLSLGKISNQVIKAHYVKKLAEILKVDERAVAEEVEKAEKRPDLNKASLEKRVARGDKTREERLAEYALALVLQREEWVLKLVEKVDEDFLPESAVKKIVVKIKKWGGKTKKWEINKFVESLPTELVEAVDSAYLTEMGKLVDDGDKLSADLTRTMEELKLMSLKKEMVEVAKEIKVAESKKQKDKLTKLKAKFVKLSKGLKN